MPTTLRPPRGHITYQPNLSVERAVRLLLGCQSEGAAHQRILHARREYPLILQGFLNAAAWERLTWFQAPAEAVLARQPVPVLSGPLVARAMAVDGIEDGTLGALAVELDDARVARAELRDLYREITVKEQLARAICARHGWQA
jgi:hypothetical protein